MSITPKIYACKDVLIMLIRQHSIDHPIKGPDLAKEVHLSYATMRELAALLTCEGWPIGADTARGYYWAKNPEDMDPKIHQLNSRIIGIAKHWRGAKRVRRKLESRSTRPRTQMALELFPDSTIGREPGVDSVGPAPNTGASYEVN